MHKYRLVVRFTNKHVICQIIFATLTGDRVLASAYSSELPRYGVKGGLKNFPAAYCTGLLLARRLLKQLKMDEKYTGVEEPTGEINVHVDGKRKFYVPEDQYDENQRPFRANLDVGLKVCTSGSKIFAAMKGASDGGLDIPHSNNLLPGFEKGETKAQNKFNAEEFKDKICGADVIQYMEYLKEEDEVQYKKQFSSMVEGGVEPDDVEEMYTSAHAAIREDPSPAKKEDKKQYKSKTHARKVKLTHAERRAAQKSKLEKYGGNSKAAAAVEEDEE